MSDRCGAHSRTTGKPCKNPPVRGRERCRMHGGTVRRGIASTHYKSGDRSPYAVPGHLVAMYAGATADRSLRSLRQDIALNRALRDEVLEKMEHGAIAAFGEAQAALMDYDRACTKGDASAKSEALSRLRVAIEVGIGYDGLVGQLLTIQEAGRRMRDTEARTLKISCEVITAEEQMALLQSMVDLLAEIVSREQLIEFVDRLDAQIGSRSWDVGLALGPGGS